MKRRFLCTLLALIMLVALLPAIAGSAKADAVKITAVQLAYNGTIETPQNGASFTNPTSKFSIASTTPAGLASELKIEAYWHNRDTNTPYYGSGTFTTGTWALYVHVRIKDPSKYEYDTDSFLKDSLFFIELGGRDFKISGLMGSDVNYYSQFIIGETETTIPIYTMEAWLRAPVIGEHPDYEPRPTERSHCYQSDYSSGYLKNDVSWYDVKAERFLNPNSDKPEDAFQEGHSYRVTMYLTPEDGYSFSDDVTGFLNDRQYSMTATNHPTWEPKQAEFQYTFWPLHTFASVSATVTAPKRGAKPDYAVKLADGSRCHLMDYNEGAFQHGVAWYDDTEDRYIKSNETFRGGHTYGVQIYLEPNPGYAFTDETKAVLNGSLTMELLGHHPKKDWTNYVYLFPKIESPKYNGTVELNKNDVQFNGKTPYVIYINAPHKPGVIVKDKNGKTVDPSKYTVTYRDNVKPGTAFADVTMKSTGEVASVWFKIYLGPTSSTTVQNVQNGIKISWAKVADAKGYVIYRRAWNLISSGWTTFERWNNTTNTTWTDTKVYAGTRYQYGIKAYYNDPMDNYNLGIVGPLKTTVRITTRVLNSVTPGNRKLTVKWTGSSLFTGYQVQVATDANFTKDVKTVTISKAKTYQTTVSGLKAKTTYYVRVRSYHIFEGTTYYGQWSNVLTGKTK